MGVRPGTPGGFELLRSGVVAIGIGALANAPAVGAAFTACPDTPSLLCDTVPVPLDRSGAVPGTINLAARIAPASDAPALGTVLFLAGGPGQAATPELPSLAANFRALLPNYNLLTFDQRGTGRSSPLRCRGVRLAHARVETKAAARCGSQLGSGPQLLPKLRLGGRCRGGAGGHRWPAACRLRGFLRGTGGRGVRAPVPRRGDPAAPGFSNVAAGYGPASTFNA